MTCAQLSAVIDRVRLNNFPIPIDLRVNREGLCVVLQVPERDSGRATTMTHHTVSTIGRTQQWARRLAEIQDSDEAVAFIYDCVRRSVEHELQECFFVDGARRYDPHPQR